ncbi:MAG TPA: c-type cytochrome [Myxococcales bacterium]|nr:c-type cytochrome [Myxococcales bacterium]
MKIFSVSFVAFAALFAAVAVAQTQPAPAAQPQAPGGGMQVPDKFTNLKILPKDITKDDLVHTMRAFNAGLGVRCDFCHVLSQEKKDFAADTKPEKQMARGMMKMVHQLNTQDFNYKDAPKATCFMCHHGEKKPQLQPPPAPDAPPAGSPH